MIKINCKKSINKYTNRYKVIYSFRVNEMNFENSLVKKNLSLLAYTP